MSLRSLVVCSDEKIVRVLRRVLSDLEIAVQHCNTAEAAIRYLTRLRLEAVIVDCSAAESAEVLRSVRNSPSNKRAVAVAIVDGQMGLSSAFEMGAHFVLYKPVSIERAKLSFRAARSLMKRERRRNVRLPIQIPVLVGKGQRTTTLDLSEGGMAVRLSRQALSESPLQVTFTVPGTEINLSAPTEVAWESANGQIGLRFISLPSEARKHLKLWFNQNALDSEKDDPPLRCRLTDLSSGACYLETATPFPVNTRVLLSMQVGDVPVHAEGVIRVMHPETGMGIEFTRSTPEERKEMEKFIHVLMESRGVLSDLMVEPDGIVVKPPQPSASHAHPSEEVEDPLLELFRRSPALPAEAFLDELRKQRQTPPSDSRETVLEL